MSLLFITGLQKSGTSLLNRMLMQQSVINNPFLPEGKLFWGDNPPFSPVDKPCGELYQKYNGERGHFLDETDFSIADRNLLLNRIKTTDIKEPILMNKNPYLTVRIKWLKKNFPDCKIVAMCRNPVANVYSLLKKYQDHEHQGAKPENGWWGIKPKNWENLLSENKLLQCSNQWNSVNQEILDNFSKIDLIVDYEQLCADAGSIVQHIISICGLEYPVPVLPVCKNLNDEYLQGSRLLSKNREFRKNQDFSLETLNETLEFPPLKDAQVQDINNICDETWLRLKGSVKNIPTSS